MRIEKGLLNFLAVVHEQLGKTKAEKVRARCGGTLIYIGSLGGWVRQNNILLEFLTKEEILKVRNRYIELDGRARVGYIHVSKDYTPGVLRYPILKYRIIEVYEQGYTKTQIREKVGCTEQYCNSVIREYEWEKERKERMKRKDYTPGVLRYPILKHRIIEVYEQGVH